jgi:uncharacterized protein (DUF2249 family)
MEDLAMTNACGCRTRSTMGEARTATRAPIQIDQLVGEIARDHPDALEVLKSFGLDHCCSAGLTLAEAAAAAGVRIDRLLGALTRPDALVGLPESRRSVVDVRDDIRNGRETFAKIVAAVRALGPDQVLVLRAPFEPLPLYRVLGKQGFAHWTESGVPDDWAVWFYRAADQAPESPPGACVGTADAVEVIDVRGLEPPQPMVRVLEALDRLGPGAELEVRHDRRPVFLYPQLDDRGFTHETDEPEPGLVRIVIRRAEPAR